MPSYDTLWGYRCTYDSQTSGCVCMEKMTKIKLIKDIFLVNYHTEGHFTCICPPRLVVVVNYQSVCP